MNIADTELPGVKILEPEVYGDERGFFFETWRDSDFRENVADYSFVQDNHSSSVCGVLRGLHYQISGPQGKLVRVVKGSVFDVAVDLRIKSSFFGKYVGIELSEVNRRMLWIPPGFAHGFLVMSPYAEFVYKCTDYYDPLSERAVRWDDPDISVNWPLSKGQKSVISSKDSLAPFLRDAECYGDLLLQHS